MISLCFSLAQICKSLDLLSVVVFVKVTNYGIENKAQQFNQAKKT